MPPTSLAPFLVAANRLKTTPRRGWQTIGVNPCESVADHTFGTALASMLLAAETGLDAGKAAQLAIVHDLSEAVTGDLLPGEVPEEEKRKREDAGMREMVRHLPEPLREQLLTLWREYATRVSPEARLVRQVDKLDMAVQATAYEEAGVNAADLSRFRESAKRQITDRALLPTLADLLKSKAQ